ncbi:salivary glue protein Sgs-3-like [Ylistrum balloti]|uniref:salivary glue protein Sgs-3-like n=1 Tax=Ylistrum balloti TaxID=509963 RepID=UPI002905EF31|nr:salivary glue protein Sgs-3-like [Ylistrum balloti]
MTEMQYGAAPIFPVSGKTALSTSVLRTNRPSAARGFVARIASPNSLAIATAQQRPTIARRVTMRPPSRLTSFVQSIRPKDLEQLAIRAAHGQIPLRGRVYTVAYPNSNLRNTVSTRGVVQLRKPTLTRSHTTQLTRTPILGRSSTSISTAARIPTTNIVSLRRPISKTSSPRKSTTKFSRNSVRKSSRSSRKSSRKHSSREKAKRKAALKAKLAALRAKKAKKSGYP